MYKFFHSVFVAILLASIFPTVAIADDATSLHPDDGQLGKIDPYHARFGRTRALVAVIGENGSTESSTELVDFVVPYGILAQSGATQTIAVATHAGILNMRPALRLQAQASIDEFDRRFPDGADYVIVPAVSKYDDPILLTWITTQAGKGATIVSICDGALVVANSGLLKGHRATAHWGTEALRPKKYPETTWLKNRRYVADGKIISSAGISAAIPVSLALVEAIAGYDRAAALAQDLGASEWSARHNSDVFHPRFGVNLWAFIAANYTNRWFHSLQQIGVPVASGIDEISLALAADAYSRTGRSKAFAISASSEILPTRNGLLLLPDRTLGDKSPPDRMLPEFDASPSALALDHALAGIADRYGRSTAYAVALDFEYPGFRK
jgi:putative intracellular protease/amidase